MMSKEIYSSTSPMWGHRREGMMREPHNTMERTTAQSFQDIGRWLSQAGLDRSHLSCTRQTKLRDTWNLGAPTATARHLLTGRVSILFIRQKSMCIRDLITVPLVRPNRNRQDAKSESGIPLPGTFFLYHLTLTYLSLHHNAILLLLKHPSTGDSGWATDRKPERCYYQQTH